jgi:surface antigen
MNLIVANLPARTLGYTSYCAAVVKLQNGNRAVLVTEAGASASGINGRLLSQMENALQAPVLGGASPIPGQGTWHMNDAEQQALAVLASAVQDGGVWQGAVLKAVVANRDICPSCAYTLQQRGFAVNGAEAVAP